MTNPSTITRTIMIFDQCQHDDIVFFTFEEDLSRLHHTYITSEYKKEELANELNNKLFDSAGKRTRQAYKAFPHDFYIPGQTAVIIAGLAP